MTTERLTPGEVLRRAREDAGWGLREPAHKLFMHDTVLAAEVPLTWFAVRKTLT